MQVRLEQPADVEAARDVHRAAFAAPAVGRDATADPFEVVVLDGLREGGQLLPTMTFVAEAAGGQVVGHVAASRATVSDDPAVALGPIGVLPRHQRQGVGRRLVEALLAAAEEQGEALVVLLGDPALYGRFGFVDSRTVGVTAPDPAWGAYFQVRPLAAWATKPLSGPASYAPPFG